MNRGRSISFSWVLRLPVVAILAVISLGLATYAAADAADQRAMFNIEEQALGTALNALALQADLEILYSPDLVENIESAGVDGEYTTAEAVRILLKDTDLTYEFTAADTLLIRSTTPTTSAAEEEPETEPVGAQESDEQEQERSAASNEPDQAPAQDEPAAQAQEPAAEEAAAAPATSLAKSW
jgi:hypothetical protein